MPEVADNAASNIARWKPAVIIFAGAYLILGVYFFTRSPTPPSQEKANGSLHRSNAIHDVHNETRRRRGALQGTVTEVEVDEPVHNTEAEVDEPVTVTEPIQDTNMHLGPLQHLLFDIARDAAARDGYLHRGVTCNECGTTPIRGIRYRCSNCFDYDLCEACEAQPVHPKTHLFYKVRIPAPFLGPGSNPPQKPVYPGKDDLQDLHGFGERASYLRENTGFSASEIECYLEQFRCIANTKWDRDPDGLGLAIDRKTFGKVFVPSDSTKPAPPGLVYDRVFAYYDMDANNLIGFTEFVTGLASLRNKERSDRPGRIFAGYDFDGDGFIERKDVLRLFRAYFVLSQTMTREVVGSLEQDLSQTAPALRDPRKMILAGTSLSSAFKSGIRSPQPRDPGAGKQLNQSGDLDVDETQTPALMEDIPDTMSRHQINGDGAVRQATRAHDRLSQRSFVSRPTQLDEDDANRLDQAMENADSTRVVAVPNPYNANIVELVPNGVNPADVGSPLLFTRSQVFPQSEAELLTASNIENSDYDESSPDTPESEDTPDPVYRTIDFLNTGIDDLLQEGTWPYSFTTSEDVKLALGPSVDIPLQNIEDITDRRKILERTHERLSADRDDDFRDAREVGVNDHWTRRRFYTDEEEGVEAPPGYIATALDAQMNTESGDRTTDTEEMVPSMRISRRSRSSSKVRFEDDMSDVDCDSRSNHSTSSKRSIPINERWGGYEIPEAEKDVGQEVLYQVLQQGLNEKLDILFKRREDAAMNVFVTRLERTEQRIWLPEIGSWPPPDPAVGEVSPETQTLTLKTLEMYKRMRTKFSKPPMPFANYFKASDAEGADEEDDDGPNQDTKTPYTIRIDPFIRSLPLYSLLIVGNYGVNDTPNRPSSSPSSTLSDQTLPQNRPDAFSDPAAATFSTNDENAPEMNLPELGKLTLMPSLKRLKWLHELDVAELEMKMREGPGRLSMSEFVKIMRENPNLAFLESWIEMGSF